MATAHEKSRLLPNNFFHLQFMLRINGACVTGHGKCRYIIFFHHLLDD